MTLEMLVHFSIFVAAVRATSNGSIFDVEESLYNSKDLGMYGANNYRPRDDARTDFPRNTFHSILAHYVISLLPSPETGKRSNVVLDPHDVPNNNPFFIPSDNDVFLTHELVVFADVEPLASSNESQLCLVFDGVEHHSSTNTYSLQQPTSGNHTIRFEVRFEDGFVAATPPMPTIELVTADKCTTCDGTKCSVTGSRRKMVDVVLYDGVIELLELRLLELASVVDEFYVVQLSGEAGEIERKNPVDELFSISRERQHFYLASVLERVHFTTLAGVAEDPRRISVKTDTGKDHTWKRLQFFLMKSGIEATDIVILGHNKDIPRESILRNTGMCKELHLPARLKMDHHVLNFNWRREEQSLQVATYPVVTYFGLLSVIPLYDLLGWDYVRLKKQFGLSLLTTINNGGWRCEDFGSVHHTVTTTLTGWSRNAFTNEGDARSMIPDLPVHDCGKGQDTLCLDFQPFPDLPQALGVDNGHIHFSKLVPFEIHNMHLRPVTPSPFYGHASHNQNYQRKFLPVRFPRGAKEEALQQGEGGRQGRCQGRVNWPTQQEVGLFIAVLSHPDNKERRDVARQTWLSRDPRLGNPHAIGTEHRFILGLSSKMQIVPAAILEEAAVHRDIIVLGVQEGYRNIYYKALGGVRYGLMMCGASYIMRANDDVYVDLKAVMASVTAFDPIRIYAGLHVGSIRVLRPEMYGGAVIPEKSSAVTWAQWPSSLYPPLIQGNALLLSADLGEEVAALTQKVWFEQLADDLRIAMVASRTFCQMVGLNASWAADGATVTCKPDADLHFDLSVNTMKQIHYNVVSKRPPCHSVKPW